MKTIEINSQSNDITLTSESKTKNLYQRLLEEFDSKAMGYASIGIIASSCLGAVAVMLVLMNNSISDSIQIVELAIITILCMLFNGTLFSHQTSKVQFNTLITSIVVSLFFILINFF